MEAKDMERLVNNTFEQLSQSMKRMLKETLDRQTRIIKEAIEEQTKYIERIIKETTEEHGKKEAVDQVCLKFADQLTITSESCMGCGFEGTKYFYRDTSEWLCERCVLVRRVCKNRSLGCTFTGNNNKCTKHEIFFCQHVTYCMICRADVPQCSLSVHYGSVHKDIMYMTGSTWRATRTDNIRGRYCLVFDVACTAVCHYWLVDSKFEFFLYTPSEQLKKFRCVVQLTNPVTGHTKTYTPDVECDKEHDWYIEVRRDKFESWSYEFDVIVEISDIV